jgi:hypothetical protein
MTKQELLQKDRTITPLIEQGQSPYQIVTNHPELNLSIRTMYTYLDNDLFTARNIGLKRKPKFKPRKCHKTQMMDRSVSINQTYTDFQSLNPDLYREMDTFHSSRELKRYCRLSFFQKKNSFWPS